MKTNRRGFFAAMFALPALLKAKPAPIKEVKLAYADTDSMVVDFKGHWTDKERKLIFKLYSNSLYGKIGGRGGHYYDISSAYPACMSRA